VLWMMMWMRCGCDVDEDEMLMWMRCGCDVDVM